jgi:hypothetical protein
MGQVVRTRTVTKRELNLPRQDAEQRMDADSDDGHRKKDFNVKTPREQRRKSVGRDSAPAAPKPLRYSEGGSPNSPPRCGFRPDDRRRTPDYGLFFSDFSFSVLQLFRTRPPPLPSALPVASKSDEDECFAYPARPSVQLM